jgi:hypothetical protein
MNESLFGLLAIIFFVAVMVFGTMGSVYVARLGKRPTLTLSDEVQGIQEVLRKLRKRIPMTDEELTLARQAVYDRGSFFALCIPLTVFCIGCFYVFGSLEHLHGARPSERTFLGVIPMFTSSNMGIRMLRSGSLRRRLPNAPRVIEDPVADQAGSSSTSSSSSS